MTDWNPTHYLSFASERARPAMDLLSRVQRQATGIVDLGCGPGNSTALLRARFPRAVITGLDASPAMIAKARTVVADADFQVADVATWEPSAAHDLVFSNALFQWVPDHSHVIRRIFAGLRPGATLALQVPDNLGEASHRLMTEAAQDPRWRNRIAKAGEGRERILPPLGYYDLLAGLAQSVEVWQTRYAHVFDGHQPIANMLGSTGLKPFLDPLQPDERALFLRHYVSRLGEAYPKASDGKVLFAFPRLFVVAIRADSPAGR